MITNLIKNNKKNHGKYRFSYLCWMITLIFTGVNFFYLFNETYQEVKILPIIKEYVNVAVNHNELFIMNSPPNLNYLINN